MSFSSSVKWNFPHLHRVVIRFKKMVYKVPALGKLPSLSVHREEQEEMVLEGRFLPDLRFPDSDLQMK